MFLNRKVELEQIKHVINETRTHSAAIMIYGRRRVGKSALVREALKDYNGIFVEFECSETLYSNNIDRLSQMVADALDMPFLATINDLLALLQAISSQDKQFVLFIDEYQFLKRSYKDGNLDSIFQIAIDQLSSKLTVILCGSYISVMKDMIRGNAPLFGRLSLCLHIKSFNYLEASNFYPSLSEKDKIAFYSVFGGMPFVLEKINEKESLEANIKRLLLDSTSGTYLVLTETLLKEIFKIDQAESILSQLGNGKRRNSDLSSALNTSSAAISQEISRLEVMEIVKRISPINRKADNKKTFYEMTDNLLRFFYTYITSNTSYLKRFGSDYVWSRFISNSINTFISKRFEGIVIEYLEDVLKNNPHLDIEDIGSYWYDLPKEGRNGEFDVVVKSSKGYSVIEAKYLSSPITKTIIDEEMTKMNKIEDLGISSLGFAVSPKASSPNKDLLWITEKDLYDKKGIVLGNKLRDFF